MLNKLIWGILIVIVLVSGCITTVQEPVNADKDITGVVGADGIKQCSTIECFVVAANECEETSLELEEDIGTIEYYSSYDSYIDIFYSYLMWS